MSKASEYAKIKRAASVICAPSFCPEEKNFAYVTDNGLLRCDGNIDPNHVPAFIKWLKETFED